MACSLGELLHVQPDVCIWAYAIRCTFPQNKGRVAAGLAFRFERLVERVERNLEVALSGGGVGNTGPLPSSSRWICRVAAQLGIMATGLDAACVG